MTTVIYSIVGMIIFANLIKILRHNATPMPKKAEYVAAFPNRVKDGYIFCGCGSSKLTSTGTFGNVGSTITSCKSCKTILYSSDNIDNKLHEVDTL